MIKTKLIRAGIFLAGFGFIAGATLFAFAWFTVSIPDPNAYVNSQSTIIQYSNGSEIGRVGTQNRQILPLAKIPLRLRYAVMAAEDRNFYSNRAFSPTGIARALLNNLKSGDLTGEGGSTITQQYAKTAFLSPSRTIQRKIKELVISLKLENALSKDQILENYLNTIYFGLAIKKDAGEDKTSERRVTRVSSGFMLNPRLNIQLGITKSVGDGYNYNNYQINTVGAEYRM